IRKAIRDGIEIYQKAEDLVEDAAGIGKEAFQLRQLIDQLRKQMYIEAKNLHFEKAAQLRDKVGELEKFLKSKEGRKKTEERSHPNVIAFGESVGISLNTTSKELKKSEKKRKRTKKKRKV
ncbi:UvrB/UvrC motif-containing protein, partial [Candidatus Omnitrophota bacterium]